MNVQGKYFVDGFKFDNEKEYKAALEDFKKIKLIEQRLNVNKPKMVLTLYNKIFETDSFRTIVGQCFMKKLYDIIIDSNIVDPDKLKPINSRDTRTSNKSNSYKRLNNNKGLNEEIMKVKSSLLYWKMATFILVVVVIVIFVVAKNSNTFNYTNAKREVTDEYSKWQYELEQKEKELIEREKNLTNSEK